MDSPHDPMDTGGSSRTGLSTAEAAALLTSDGYNELPAAQRRSAIRIAAEVLRQPMFALLMAGGLVYLLIGDRAEAVMLIAFAGLSVSITVVQELRSERVLDALRQLASPRARVIRDGQPVTIAGRNVVRDDLLMVGEGDRVAADARLLSAEELMVDESLLSGESVPVRKVALDGSHATRPVDGDESSLLYAGSLILRGSGTARVVATGLRSEIGKIGRTLGDIETEQPHLKRQIHWLVRDFAIGGALVGLLTVLLYGGLRGSWLDATLGGIAVGMSMLPEEFALVMAVFMAMGAWRISQVRVLTRRASAIEALGAATVLCTDKTGTLTENRMSVIDLQAGDARWSADGAATESAIAADDGLRRALVAALYACPQQPRDPMDLAIHALAADHIPEQAQAYANRRVERAYGLRPDFFAVANVLREANGTGAYAKGAVEAIATLCRMTPQQRAHVQALAEQQAQRGVRMLAIACCTDTGAINDAASLATFADRLLDGAGFVFCGLIGFADPLRHNVPDAVAQCRSAGIRVIMITGDYPATASAIAAQAGLPASAALSGDQVDELDDRQLAEQLKTVSVFARIRPAQKLRIVQNLKANGEVVAMTGDGVNDAPAIKAAHIGIAMGGRGTDVAREASAIVLLDDDFGSIVTTIRLGRRIYDNLGKAIEYIVAVHIPIAGMALLPLILGLPLILTPILIAFLEMVIDPACSVVFEAEAEEADVMQRPPRDPTASLLQPRRIAWAVLQGVVALSIMAATLIGAARLSMPEAELRALAFTALVLINVGLILVNLSRSASLRQLLRRPNRPLWMLIAAVSAMLAAALYWPPASRLLHFGRLHADDLGHSALIGLISLLALEWIKSRWFSGQRRSR